jgi:AbiV family abortive infection protein
MPLKIEPILEACLANAERLLESAKAVRSVPGCNHIAFNLAVLALEEIGKSILLFHESLELKSVPRDGEEVRRPLDWIEDHERKLLWAIWFGEAALDWRTIPQRMESARLLSQQRLRVLYFDPTEPDAQAGIDDEYLDPIISMTEARLQMEKAKKYKGWNEQERSDIQWFFIASGHPEVKPFIFSKGSMEKQAEFDDGAMWIKWLRKTVEDSQRAAYEVAQREMERQQPSDKERHDDKWKLRIKLKSWSHSIRQNQLTKFNENIEKIKPHKGSEHNDLTVDFIIPKSVPLQAIWSAGMHSCVIFVSSINIATFGFFWWYLPTFVSRFQDSIIDLESNCGVVVERVPELKIVWPQQALKQDVLEQNLGLVFAFVARARDEHFAVFHKYFGVLGFMAKNDIFTQFEHHLVHDFMECLEMALKSYGDWDGTPSTFESVINGWFSGKEGSDEFAAMVMDLRRIAGEVAQRSLKEPVTLEHAIRAKVAFDTYIHLKARAFFAEEHAKGNIELAEPLAGSAAERSEPG